MMTARRSWVLLLTALHSASCFQPYHMIATAATANQNSLRITAVTAPVPSSSCARYGSDDRCRLLNSRSELSAASISQSASMRPSGSSWISPTALWASRSESHDDRGSSNTNNNNNTGGSSTTASNSRGSSGDSSVASRNSASSSTKQRFYNDEGFVATFTTTQLESSSPKKQKQRRRKNYGAPLVDSSLLRFLSVEKSQRQPVEADADPDSRERLLRQYGLPAMMGNGTLADTPSPAKKYKIARELADILAREERAFQLSKSETKITDKAIPEAAGAKIGAINGANSTEVNVMTNEGAMVQETASDESLSQQDVVVTSSVDPWMGQYNRNRIAQTLMALGIEEESAQIAGEKVQDLVLVRAARRRVRIFLRQRESLWSGYDGDSFDETALEDIKILRNEDLPHPEYGFEDVVELMQEYGLTGKDIATILAHSPSLALMMPRRSMMAAVSDRVSVDGADAEDGAASAAATGETLEETLNRSFRGLLMTTLKLRRYDARQVLRTCPGLLSMRGSKSAIQVVAMLTKIGVSTRTMAKDTRKLPNLLSRSPAALFRLVAFLASDVVRMPVLSIGPMLRRNDCQDLLDAVAPIPRVYALSQPNEKSNSEEDADQMDDPNVASALFGRDKELRRQRIDEVFANMTESAWILRNEIGTEDLGKVVSAYPSVLLLDVERQVLPVASYLMDELGIVEGDLPRVLQLYPTLLGKDIRDMEGVENYLVSLGVEESNLASIFRAFPALLSMDIEDMEPVVRFLRSIGIVDVGRFITRLPPILGYSVENELIPKWRLLQSISRYAKFELLRFPAYFSYPYDKVVRSRYAYLVYKGLSTDFAVDAVVRHGDADFAQRIAGDIDGGVRYKAFCNARRVLAAKKNRRTTHNGRNRPQQTTQMQKNGNLQSNRPEGPQQ